MESLFTTPKSIISVFFSIALILFIDSCKKDPVINIPPPPKITITSVKPLTGHQGDTVFIIGTNFNLNPDKDTVKFNGITARVQNAKSDTLFVIVPAGNSTGVVTVNGIAAPGPGFTVSITLVSITAVKPSSGKQGDTILITGAHFNLNPSLDTVKFNGITAQIQKANTDSLFVTVPQGSSTGVITVNGISAPPPDFVVLSSDSANIYFGGYGMSTITNNQIAEYWKNGVPVILSDGTKRETTSGIFVSGSDIYLAGNQVSSTNSYPEYWKNGNPIIINDSLGTATAITVSGNDVYVAGTLNGRFPFPFGSMAVYWKNGTEVKLTNGIFNSSASCIAVSGNDVYVTGVEVSNLSGTNVNQAKIWKNGVATNLSDGTTVANVTSIVVVGNDVYAAGFVQDPITGIYVAKYWKNGVAVNLSDGTKTAYAIAVFVSGSDIYVAGLEKNLVTDVFDAKYWKNGTEVKLTNGSNGLSTTSSSIFVFENDVYVLGSFGAPVYWKNSNLMNFSGYASDVENSLFVQKR
jgi:IPT/TIG domain